MQFWKGKYAIIKSNCKMWFDKEANNLWACDLNFKINKSN